MVQEPADRDFATSPSGGQPPASIPKLASLDNKPEPLIAALLLDRMMLDRPAAQKALAAVLLVGVSATGAILGGVSQRKFSVFTNRPSNELDWGYVYT